MNDGACDPQGRFWAGTLADDHHDGGGALYRLERDGRTELMLDGLTISNGLGWSPDGDTMYLVDSGPRVIHAFAFDADRGTISAGRILITVSEDVGAPDGMTVDAAGDLWVAIYGVDGSTGTRPTARYARRTPSPPANARAVPSVGPAWTSSSSRPRRRAGRTSSVSPSPQQASCTDSTRMQSADRQRRFVPNPAGGRGER